MISHKYKCIFIHIPRCAGSSMEKAIVNKSWYYYEKSTKHILASTAKKIYKDYWNDYFKFSFVRNPWDRSVSLTRYGGFYGCKIEKGKLNLNNSKHLIVDPRSKSRFDKKSFIDNAVYLNIIDEEIDFIGKFENLKEDWRFVCNSIGMNEKKLNNHRHYKSFNKNHYSRYYTDSTKQWVSERYKKDIERFGYKFINDQSSV